MSNKRSNARKSRNQHDTATRKQNEARKRQNARKQHMPAQNKLLMLGGLAVLCVALFIPELLSLLGPRIAVIVKWIAAIAIVLAILATRCALTVTDYIGRIVDKILNRDDEEYYDDEDDDEWDDDEDWDDFDDEDVVEEPQPAVRRRAPATPAPAAEEARQVECSKEDFELFMQFMEFREAQKKAQALKPEAAPKTSKK